MACLLDNKSASFQALVQIITKETEINVYEPTLTTMCHIALPLVRVNL